MSRRDYIGEILSKKERLPAKSRRLERVSERIADLRQIVEFLDQLKPNSELLNLLEETENLPSELHNLTIHYRDIHYETMRYIPIGAIACLEGYFRLAFADLIDYGSPYRENASKFDVKFSIETAISLQRHSLSLGEFVAHLLTINKLADIDFNMSTIMGEDFLKVFKEMRPKLETRRSLFEQDDEEVSNWVLGNVQRLFELRHMYSHEPNPPIQEEDFYSILGGMEAVVEFLWVSDTIIDERLEQQRRRH